MCILDIRMKVNAARRNSEGAHGGVYYGNYGGDVPRRPARREVICKYWVAGCCRNDHCKFSHGGLLQQNLDCLNVNNTFAPKKWCRDLNAPQKRMATVTRTGPLKVKATTPLKLDTIHPAKKRITSRLIEDPARTLAQKKNLSTAITKKETVTPNVQDEAVQEKVDDKKTIMESQVNSSLSKVEKVCEQWAKGDCTDGAKCTYLHSWFRGDGFIRMALLQGHGKAISGITLPYGSDTLYSSSSDGTLRSWNCHTGQCADVINLDGEIGALISVGPWLFVGIPNSISAKNIETSAEYVLQGVVGQVHSVLVVNDIIFAGAQDGVILVWKASSESDILQPSATLRGHDKAVVSMSVGGNHLYTGSIDHTVKVSLKSLLWDKLSLYDYRTTTKSLYYTIAFESMYHLAPCVVRFFYKLRAVLLALNLTNTSHDFVVILYCLNVDVIIYFVCRTSHVWDVLTLQCIQTLSGHKEVVTSLLCLDQFLISSSLDQTIKIWAVNENGKYEVNYTHQEDHGVLALAGMNDFKSKPILLCACSDNSVRVYELPSFSERGRLFTNEAVQKIHVGPSGLFFTGDRSGCIAVWKLSES